MSVHGYTQYAVILFRDAPKKTFYLGIIRIRHAQGRAGHHACDPLLMYPSLRHYLNRVPGKFQCWGLGWHGNANLQDTRRLPSKAVRVD